MSTCAAWVWRLFFLIGHHARPRRPSATAPLRTGADMCKTGAGAGSSAGADTAPKRRRSNHGWTDDQAGKKKRSDSTPDPGGHRPQRPYAQGRTRAKQDQAQASAPIARKVKACQHRHRWRQAGARRGRHTKQECRATRARHCNFCAKGGTSQCSSRVEEERDKQSRGSPNGVTVRRTIWTIWCAGCNSRVFTQLGHN